MSTSPGPMIALTRRLSIAAVCCAGAVLCVPAVALAQWVEPPAVIEPVPQAPPATAPAPPPPSPPPAPAPEPPPPTPEPEAPEPEPELEAEPPDPKLDPEPEPEPEPPPAPPSPPPQERGPPPPAREDPSRDRLRGVRLPTPPEITLARRAELLMIEYLQFWSAPNRVTLSTMPTFYGREVEFHGKRMSLRALMEEKRRFARRWPERRYTARPDSVAITCDVAARTCRVSALVDFTAVAPARNQRSQGTSTLDLTIAGADGQPTIVVETSKVVSRGGDGGDLDEAERSPR